MTLSPIRLRSPADLVAVVPRVLGFQPRASIVLISLRQRRIGLTQRLDLPCPGEEARAAETMVRPLLRQEPDSALIVGYDDEPGQSGPMIEQLTLALARHEVPVIDRIVVHDGRWRSLDCTDPDCCPREGTPVLTEAEAANLLAEFVAAGVAPLASRAELEGTVEARPAAGQVSRLVETADRSRRSQKITKKTTTRESLAAAWARALDPRPDAPDITPANAAVALRSLRMVGVRDGISTVLMPSSLAPDRLPTDVRELTDTIREQIPVPLTEAALQRGVQERLKELCRLAPDEHAAPPLTVLAAYAWWRGDGATARVALARALRVEPDYRLARLLQAMVDHAIRPPGD